MVSNPFVKKYVTKSSTPKFSGVLNIQNHFLKKNTYDL